MDYKYTTHIIFSHCGCKKLLSTVYAKYPVAGEMEKKEIRVNEKCKECRRLNVIDLMN